MQKFSYFTFVCCVMLLFTACKKETLLETTNDLNPKSGLSKTTTISSDIMEAMTAKLDIKDSMSVEVSAARKYTSSSQTESNSCNGSTNNSCGSKVTYSSCYYSYQIFNDYDNIYVDLNFPSSVVGYKTDCNGNRCEYYVTPCILLDLYNANGSKIGSVEVANSNIKITETRFTFNLSQLRANYPSVKCVKLRGSFYRMKKCGSNICRVGTVCITQKQFCIQDCPPPPNLCPTVNSVSVDKLKVCGSGSIKGTVSVNGDASKTMSSWTIDGIIYNGNSVSIPLPLNNTCAIVTKNIHVSVVCTTDQSVLSEKDFSIEINPSLSPMVNVDNSICQAIIDLSCTESYTISWTLGSTSGTGAQIPLSSIPQILNYSVTALGCTTTGVENDVYCLPLLQNNATSSKN